MSPRERFFFLPLNRPLILVFQRLSRGPPRAGHVEFSVGGSAYPGSRKGSPCSLTSNIKMNQYTYPLFCSSFAPTVAKCRVRTSCSSSALIFPECASKTSKADSRLLCRYLSPPLVVSVLIIHTCNTGERCVYRWQCAAQFRDCNFA